MWGTSVSSLSPVNKWVTVIFFLLIIPPIGIYYIWEDMNYFKSKLPLIMLLFGGVSLVSAIISLTQWLPSLREHNIEYPFYISIIFVAIILFCIVNIIFAFIINNNIKVSQEVSKVYTNLAIIFLLIILVLFPIITSWVKNSIQAGIYQKIIN